MTANSRSATLFHALVVCSVATSKARSQPADTQVSQYTREVQASVEFAGRQRVALDDGTGYCVAVNARQGLALIPLGTRSHSEL
jgi:hypothetical protein